MPHRDKSVRFQPRALNIEMMDSEDIIDFLRENLEVIVDMSDSYECESRYVSCSVTVRLAGQELSSDYSSVNVSNGVPNQ